MTTTLSDRYQLHELVGSGAAGRVYRARDLRLHRDVAVKRLRADALGGVETRERFAREALALARVSDPHVLAVFDVSTQAEDSYLVTDYCAEGSLADRLRGGVLTTPRARELAQDVSAGLSAMHAAGIVHRDIKPSNILRLGGRWVIGDLGIARLDGAAPLTQTGAVIGTPDYWAPETARGAVPTEAVDVYGLGCVLYEALSGRPPFRADSPLATGLLHASAAPPPLAHEIWKADPQLAELVMRLLAKDPARRPTAGPLRRELAAQMAQELGDTLVRPESSRAAATASALPQTLAYPPASVARRRRLPRRALLAVAALVLLSAVGALALGRGEGRAGSSAVTPPHRSSTSTPPAIPEATATPSSARIVPALEGRNVRSATAALRQRGLDLRIGGTTASSASPGLVVAQSPAANRRTASGTTVSVMLSAGPAQTTQVRVDSPEQAPAKSKPAKHHGNGHGRGHGHGKQRT